MQNVHLISITYLTLAYRVISTFDPGCAIFVNTHTSAILVHIRNAGVIESTKLVA